MGSASSACPPMAITSSPVNSGATWRRISWPRSSWNVHSPFNGSNPTHTVRPAQAMPTEWARLSTDSLPRESTRRATRCVLIRSQTRCKSQVRGSEAGS